MHTQNLCNVIIFSMYICTYVHQTCCNYLLDYVKISNLKGRIGIIKVPKQDENTGNLHIL